MKNGPVAAAAGIAVEITEITAKNAASAVRFTISLLMYVITFYTQSQLIS